MKTFEALRIHHDDDGLMQAGEQNPRQLGVIVLEIAKLGELPRGFSELMSGRGLSRTVVRL